MQRKSLSSRRSSRPTKSLPGISTGEYLVRVLRAVGQFMVSVALALLVSTFSSLANSALPFLIKGEDHVFELLRIANAAFAVTLSIALLARGASSAIRELLSSSRVIRYGTNDRSGDEIVTWVQAQRRARRRILSIPKEIDIREIRRLRESAPGLIIETLEFPPENDR
jgi:hypothetical protein